jgi:hypothetical protein
MFNLFGTTEESKRRRDDLILRQVPAGARELVFRKPPQATQNPGKLLGLRFKEGPIGNVYVAEILPNSEAESYESQGKLSVGDEVVMVSATFGDETWSCRGCGIGRLTTSMRARSGSRISLVFENAGKNDRRVKQAGEDAKKQRQRLKRLQGEMAREAIGAKQAAFEAKQEAKARAGPNPLEKFLFGNKKQAEVEEEVEEEEEEETKDEGFKFPWR